SRVCQGRWPLCFFDDFPLHGRVLARPWSAALEPTPPLGAVRSENRWYLSKASHFRLYDCHWLYVYVGFEYSNRRGYAANRCIRTAADCGNRWRHEESEALRYCAHAGHRLLGIDW